MNLACNYPIIFWNTANLIVDSAGVDDGENPEDIDQDEIAENIEEAIEEVENTFEDEMDTPTEIVVSKEKVKRVKKTVDYGKAARAIGKFKSYGINILPPDINKSSYTFTPNVEQNSITYGLRGITRISTDLIKQIITNRPYSSLKNFLEINNTNKLQTLNLIKSGAFDNIENIPREQIMHNYIESIADKKHRLTLQNMNMLITKNLIPEDMLFYSKLFSFNKFLKQNKDQDYYKLNDSAINFIDKNFSVDLISNGDCILQKTWDNTYKKAMDPMRKYLKEHEKEMLDTLNQSLFDEMNNKYALGNISSWEMDSISFYYHDHELAKSARYYNDFFSLSEEPEVDYSFISKSGQEIKVFKLFKIIGTVIDKNKLKNTISLLTPTGVVQVKIYKNQYSIYDKQVSQKDIEGKKHILEKSWFQKGTMLMVQGIRRGDNFIPKKNKQSVFPIISKIINIKDDGSLEFQYERMEVDA